MLVVPQSGEQWSLDNIGSALNGNLPAVHLFQNDYVPVNTTTLSQLVECTFAGYVAQATYWASPSVLQVDGSYLLTSTGTNNWVWGPFGPGNTVYGYYLTTNDGLTLLWAERSASPLPMMTVMDTIALVLKLSLRSQF